MTRLLLLLVILAVAAPRPPERPAPIPTASHGTGIEQGASRAPAVAPGTSALRVDPRPSEVPPAAGEPLTGRASWYRTPGLTAAAGPALRRALGDWRGVRVVVCAGECVAVTLTDWCQCHRGERSERLIDLSDGAFSRLEPLAVGLVRVRVVNVVPPETDTEAR